MKKFGFFFRLLYIELVIVARDEGGWVFAFRSEAEVSIFELNEDGRNVGVVGDVDSGVAGEISGVDVALAA